MDWSTERGELAAALAKAQAELGALTKTSEAKIKSSKGDFGYTFATLADAIAVCRPALSAQGIALLQEATSVDGGIEIRTTLVHSSGQWCCAAPLYMPVNGNAQAVGSAVTYGRRYQLLGMVFVAPEDDDGAGAESNPPPRHADQRAPTRASPRPSGPPPSRGYLDLPGPRCSGRGANIATANNELTLALTARTKRGFDDIWTSVCSEAKIGGVNTPNGPVCPTAEQLLCDDGKRVRILLEAWIADCQVEPDPPGAP